MTDALNMDAFIDEDFASVDAIRYMQSGSRNAKGRWVKNTEINSTHKINLQPLTERELTNLGVGGERVEDFRKFYVNDGDLYSLTPQDEWEFNTPDLYGRRFSVFKMDNRPWRNYCKCIISLVTEIITYGASFDGTNDYLTRGADLTGNVDGKKGIFAIRIRFNGGNGTVHRILSANGGFIDVQRTGANKLQVTGTDTVSALALQLISGTTVTDASGYVNLLIAWDLGAITAQLYLDDSEDAATTVAVNSPLDYTRTNWGIGARDIGTDKLNADINFMYFNSAEYLDISVEANRRKFFDINGNPVIHRDSDGSSVTGSIPIIYQAGKYDQWGNNKGSGGGFNVVGALTEPIT